MDNSHLVAVLKAVASILAAIAWPGAFLVAVLILKKPLTRLIGLLRRLKAGGVEAEFAEALPELEKKAEAIDLPDATTGTSTTEGATIPGATYSSSPVEHYTQLSQISPRSAVMEAWIVLESTLEELAKKNGLPRTHSTRENIVQLRKDEVLCAAEANMVQQLGSLRTKAAHSPDFALSTREAFDFAMIALRLAAGLRAK